jgi:hypothetical protein
VLLVYGSSGVRIYATASTLYALVGLTTLSVESARTSRPRAGRQVSTSTRVPTMLLKTASRVHFGSGTCVGGGMEHQLQAEALEYRLHSVVVWMFPTTG